MKTSSFLTGVRNCIKSVDPVFYKEYICRRNKTLLKSAEEENQKRTGKKVGSVTDPHLRLIWATMLCLERYVEKRAPKKLRDGVTVSILGDCVCPFIALSLIQEELRRAFYVTVTNSLKVGFRTIVVGKDWTIVVIPVGKVSAFELARSDYLYGSYFCLRGIIAVNSISAGLVHRLVETGNGDYVVK